MNAKQPLKRHMGQRAKNAVSNTAVHLLLIVISVILAYCCQGFAPSMRDDS